MQLSYRGVKYTVPASNVTVENGDLAHYRGASYRTKKVVGAVRATVNGLRYRGAQVR